MTHWCGPCKIMAPEREKLARHHRGELRVGRLTVDRHPELNERFDITTFPTLLLLKDGKEVARLDEVRDYPRLLSWVQSAVPGEISPLSAQAVPDGQAPARDTE
jgi:thioredoxin-like negative regulator of GroEL